MAGCARKSRRSASDPVADITLKPRRPRESWVGFEIPISCGTGGPMIGHDLSSEEMKARFAGYSKRVMKKSSRLRGFDYVCLVHKA